jgi:tRNA dimethylallyltransferase
MTDCGISSDVNGSRRQPGSRNVLAICGPTGVGKTEVAVELCRRRGLHLVSADSRQVYCCLDIGTAKPRGDVRREVTMHMVDMVQPTRRYSAADYARDALAVMRRLAHQGIPFLVVGGSGLYLRALFEPLFEASKPDAALRRRLARLDESELYERLRRLDPDRANELHPHDRQRLMRALEVCELAGRPMSELTRTGPSHSGFEPVYAVLNMPRDLLYQRIDARFDAMMRDGLLEEVRRLRAAGFDRDTYVANAYGYAELLAYLDGELTLMHAVARAKAKTRAYARRQLTWFRGLKQAHWFEHVDAKETADRLEPLLERVLGDKAGAARPV